MLSCLCSCSRSCYVPLQLYACLKTKKVFRPVLFLHICTSTWFHSLLETKPELLKNGGRSPPPITLFSFLAVLFLWVCLSIAVVFGFRLLAHFHLDLMRLVWLRSTQKCVELLATPLLLWLWLLWLLASWLVVGCWALARFFLWLQAPRISLQLS